MKKFIVLLSLIAMMNACTNNRTDLSDNPFSVEWDTPYGLPPFAQIKPDHYLPAIKAGISQQEAEIKAIVENGEAPSFENTIVAFDRSGALLAKVCGVFFNLAGSDSSDSIRKIEAQISPLLSEHNDNLFMNPDLFKRVEAVYLQRETLNLSVEQLRTLEKIYRHFIRNGVALDAEKQAKLRELNKQIADLEQKFSNNLLAETNTYELVLEATDLDGLPQDVRDAAALEAKEAGKEGKFLFRLQKPSWIPFMQYSARRDLREIMFKAYANRGNNDNEHDTKQIILDLMQCRIAKASILGFDSPANFFLDESMAKNSATVDGFLEKIFASALEKAKKEREALQAVIDREKGGFKLAAWDWDYYTEKLRKEKYALNEEEIKPYFKMENVRQGVFAVAGKLYGLTFEQLTDVPIYHPEVEAFKVMDADGSLLGIFYSDYYPRQSKRSGAWMSNFREQSIVDGNDIRPIIVNVGNFTKPIGDAPALLSLDDVETMFHEFGHALHGLLTKCNYVTVSGTNVSRDYVELPSQVLENWAFEPEVLALYAKHYQTGEVIPAKLVKKIRDVATFNQGFMTTELTAAAILDMQWHKLNSVDGINVLDFEKQVLDKIGLIDEIIPRYRSTYFNHIFNTGYSAGYYSYLWAEVLDKDAFELFRERGIFDSATAVSFRKNILEKGDSDDPMTLYRQFRGADPNPDAMLKGRGLK
ncbi:MAG: M3 family metallopeptidase [Prevotellaceae bacterium]|jgi:peptidyl-dipeptidase Dcp|nr:M3 family metallopeptidase [Prevotellaceae bacterium]